MLPKSIQKRQVDLEIPRDNALGCAPKLGQSSDEVDFEESERSEARLAAINPDRDR